MSEFLTAYGLWILVALLVVIALVFLLSGKKNTDADPIAEPAPPPLPVALEPTAATIAPIAIAIPPQVAPVAEEVAPEPLPVSPSATSVPEGADNLLQLKGVGPKLATLLGELGVTSFAQIAAWTETDLATLDARLGNFKGRPVRDQWTDQAKYLAAGDVAGFEAKYGKL